MAAPRVKKKIKREISNSKKATDSNAVETDFASYVLTNFPLILQNIFEYFPARTLNTCERVCKFWKETSDRVLKARSPFYWDFFTEDEEEAINAGFNDPIFYMLTEILKSTKRMPIKPKTTIIFMSKELADRIEDYATQGTPNYISDLEWRLRELNDPTVNSQECSPPGRTNDRLKRNHFNLVEWFQYQMPFDSHVSAVVTKGVIGTFWNSRKSFENESDSAFSYFCCSQNDEKMSLIPVDLGTEFIDKFIDSWLSQQHWDLFNTDYEVKKVMYFKDDEANGDVALALTEEYSQALVTGAVVESLEFPILAKSEIIIKTSCIAFCGKNVRVASVVMDCNSMLSQLEDYMKELKSHGLPEEKSVAFMFASVDNGFDQFEDFGVQSTCFREYFPKTPIFGTFVEEEIGCTFPGSMPKLPEIENEEDLDIWFVYRDQLHSKLYHTSKTILCLVSFDSKIILSKKTGFTPPVHLFPTGIH